MNFESLKSSVDCLEQTPYADSKTYAPLLRLCGRAKMTEQGRRIHRHIEKSGHERDTFVGNLLVEMYGRCGGVAEAKLVFDGIKNKNLFSWNIILSAYALNGCLIDARKLFEFMPVRDVVSWNTLIGAYALHGSLLEARILFERIPHLNVVSWNAMITAYARRDDGDESFRLFNAMQLEGLRPNGVTITVVLDAWDQVNDRQFQVERLEDFVVANGLLVEAMVGNAFMNVFGKLARLDKVEMIFGRMIHQDIVSWTTRISAYVRNGRPKAALEMFCAMDLEGLHPDKITLISLNEACGDLGDLKHAGQMYKEIMEMGLERDTKVGNSLVSMYGRCGCLVSARKIFERIQFKDVISWTALMTSNTQTGKPLEALSVFRLMDLEGMGSDKVACISAIDACASAGSLSQGRLIHFCVACTRTTIDAEFGNALLNMYAKCGSLEDVRRLLRKTPTLDILGWNAVITAYAQNARYLQVMQTYRIMTLEGCRPDSITLVGVLNACSHTGSIKKSCECFASMFADHGIEPTLDHYVCVSDLLGRVGQVGDAEELLSSMPIRPNEIAWRSLLGACGINADIGRGKVAANNILNP